MAAVRLRNRTIDDASEPYVIAEIGVNHEGSLDLAHRLIDLAKAGGAQAAKFQTYKAGLLASRHSPAYWDLSREPTRSQFELFQKYDRLDLQDYVDLARHCEEVGIDFLSTLFDIQSVDALAPYLCTFKIASADLTNTPLLRAVGRHSKPVLLSTGASTLAEIELALDELRRAGAGTIVLLHCVLNYPTPDDQAHLGMIDGLRRAFPDLLIGYSDHTVPGDRLSALLIADTLGARILEKHFTHDKTLPGNDHYHAMDAADLERFWVDLRQQRALLGFTRSKAPLPSEACARQQARRSIVVAHDIAAGETITADKLTTKRPGTGVSPLHWDDVLGSVALRPLPSDHILRWSDVDVGADRGAP
jgi:sialic acid synthase SpsE